tara:strand:+ start:233 stop:496 length:264 start_codon:yes stop_codon:yes gene_type:complete
MIITISMTKAKEIHKAKIRNARKPLLEEQDVLFQRALEASASTTDIVSKKQQLRDATATTAINNASNITELKAAWDTSLLGATPYRH